MKLTTEITLEQMSAAFLEGIANTETILSSVGRSFPDAAEQADAVLAQGSGNRPTEKVLSQ